jgi:hypothetical protein
VAVGFGGGAFEDSLKRCRGGGPGLGGRALSLAVAESLAVESYRAAFCAVGQASVWVREVLRARKKVPRSHRKPPSEAAN